MNPDVAHWSTPEKGNKYVRTERVLIPYLKSANVINKLVAAVQDRPELASFIRIVYGAQEIGWNDYFFDIHQYCDLLSLLMTREDTERRPMALTVDIISGQAEKKTTEGIWQIRAHSCPCIMNDTDHFVVRPVLYVADAKLAENIRVATTLLICGQPQIAKNMYQPKNSKMNPRVDLSFEIYHRLQICAYNSKRTN